MIRQGWHGPPWHSSAQRCCPQFKMFSQGLEQWTETAWPQRTVCLWRQQKWRQHQPKTSCWMPKPFSQHFLKFSFSLFSSRNSYFLHFSPLLFLLSPLLLSWILHCLSLCPASRSVRNSGLFQLISCVLRCNMRRVRSPGMKILVPVFP